MHGKRPPDLNTGLADGWTEAADVSVYSFWNWASRGEFFIWNLWRFWTSKVNSSFKEKNTHEIGLICSRKRERHVAFKISGAQYDKNGSTVIRIHSKKPRICFTWTSLSASSPFEGDIELKLPRLSPLSRSLSRHPEIYVRKFSLVRERTAIKQRNSILWPLLVWALFATSKKIHSLICLACPRGNEWARLTGIGGS